MADKKIIAVVGATGAQGGGLVRAILNDPSGGFAARALTRNTSSTAAQQLAALGAEVVAANVDDPACVQKAFNGAYAAYCVTFFMDHFSPQKENAQAAAMADAVKQAGLKHVIWSTLEDSRRWIPLSDNRMPTLMGKYKVPHFDAKGESDILFDDLPTTYLLTSFYWDNFIHFGMGPKPGPDGKLAITLPMGDALLPGIAAEDIGKCAYGIFKAGDKWKRNTVGVAGEHLSGHQMAAGLSKALGQPIAYNAISPDAFRRFGFPGAEEIGNMFQFDRDFSSDLCDARSVDTSHELNPELQNFETWLSRNASRIPTD